MVLSRCNLYWLKARESTWNNFRRNLKLERLELPLFIAG